MKQSLNAIPLLIVRGTWESMGKTVGKKQKQAIQEIFQRIRLPQSCTRLLPQQLNFVRQTLPRQFEYLCGLSKGSGQSLESLLMFLSWEEAAELGDHCSSLLGVEKGRWFIGHNEDESISLWKNRLYFIQHIPSEGVPFTALQYAGQLPGPSLGVNNKGIALAMDNIRRPHVRPHVGYPMSCLGFEFLQSRSWAEVEQVYRRAQANRGMHFLLVQGSDRAASFEFFEDTKARRMIRPWFFHTNHPLLPKTKQGSSASISSKQRGEAFRAFRLSKPTSTTEALACLRTPLRQGGVKQDSEKKDTQTLATCLVIPETGDILRIDPKGARIRF